MPFISPDTPSSLKCIVIKNTGMTGEATRDILNDTNGHEKLLCEEFGRDY